METDFDLSSSESTESELEDDLESDSSSNISEAPSLSFQSGSNASINLQYKLLNRERIGYSRLSKLYMMNKVPTHLRFYLLDIVPKLFSKDHMFMGLSACGQYLLSYKVNCIETSNNYAYNLTYKYTLHFWIFEPHKQLKAFYNCCLFDDHGVDGIKEVTMIQWRCSDPRILIVHGAAEDENEDSYLTYIKVPKLGCLDCKQLRNSNDNEDFLYCTFCLKCNLTVHTKYSATECDRKFDPCINLICPERILIVANGFVHMLHIDLELSSSTHHNNNNNHHHHHHQTTLQSIGHTLISLPRPATTMATNELLPLNNTPAMNTNSQNNIVAQIIADFSDNEIDANAINPTTEQSLVRCITDETCDEVVITCNAGNKPNISAASTINSTLNTASTSSQREGLTMVSLVSHKGRRHQRIVTKSFRNGITTIDMQNTIQSTNIANNVDKSSTYEFSEDNEKCEKISTLRKRRLADKKYEFSEDNAENIIPFTKVRLAGKRTIYNNASTGPRTIHVSPTTSQAANIQQHPFFNSPCASPSSSPRSSHCLSNTSGHILDTSLNESSHYNSPSISHANTFRSPCSSPVSGLNMMRSPIYHVATAQIYNQKSPPTPTTYSAIQQASQSYNMGHYKPLGMLSPLQIFNAKRNQLDYNSSMSPNNAVPFLSPRREEYNHRSIEVPLQGGTIEKPICTKKFKRRFVEEDDAASVITSEEDDCISPGYHTSLPVEVHGSGYAEMHMISQASYQQLRCNSVVITQHSFDLETFTYYVISTLCQKNQKNYDVFYDWACELISVCPLSYTIICLLMAQFSAQDQIPITPTNCLNCAKKIDCAFHRRQFECRILFTWNMESGEWEVLDYGELTEIKLSALINPTKRNGTPTLSLSQRAKKLAHEMSISLKQTQDYSENLRILSSDIKKSKTYIKDLDNMVEFHLRRLRHNIL